MFIYLYNTQNNIFIIQLYFINELLCLKVFVANWWFCSWKRRHKTQGEAEAYVSTVVKVLEASVKPIFYNDCKLSLSFRYA